MERAKIINRYTLHVVDVEAEVKQADYRLEAGIRQIGIPAEELVGLQKRAKSRRKAVLSESQQRSIQRYAQLQQRHRQEVEQLLSLLPFQTTEPPELSPLDEAAPYYEEMDGVIMQKWEVRQNVPHLVEQEMERLKRLLAESDYKIIKAYEYALVGKGDSGDLEEVHRGRQWLRDRISELKVVCEKI